MRRPSEDVCQCSHRWADHRFDFPDPCDVPLCMCRAFVADGFQPDPDERHDRETLR